MTDEDALVTVIAALLSVLIYLAVTAITLRLFGVI